MTSTAPTRTAPEHAPVDADLADADAPVAPEADTTPASPSTSALADAVAAGTVTLYRLRGTGTLRHLAYLAPGTPDREVAQWFSHRLDTGATIPDLAAEAGVRPLTVRRALWSLDLAEAIEDGDLDDLYVVDEPWLVLGDADDLGHLTMTIYGDQA
jgi:hypothetical protein